MAKLKNLFFGNFLTKETKEAIKIQQNLEVFDAYAPSFSKWDGNLFDNEKVRSSLELVANHRSKMSIKIDGSAKPVTTSFLSIRPNGWQTWSQFLAYASNILELNGTCFIAPLLDPYDENTIDSLVVLNPIQCSVVGYNGEPYLKYLFKDGKTGVIELTRCGVLVKNQYGDYMFGSDNRPLKPTMELINIHNQGISEAVKQTATFKFMGTVRNFLKPEDLKKEREEFSKMNFQADTGGMLLFPNTYENVQQIKSEPYTVNPEEMKQIKDDVYSYFGVNEDLLQSKASSEVMQCFYDNKIEPFGNQFSDVVTFMLFTLNEINRGNKFRLAGEKLDYMSIDNKIKLVQELGNKGAMTSDEMRSLFNLPPLANNLGEFIPVRGEFYDLKHGRPDQQFLNSKGGE